MIIVDSLVVKYQGAYTHDEILYKEWGLIMDWMSMHNEINNYQERYFNAKMAAEKAKKS